MNEAHISAFRSKADMACCAAYVLEAVLALADEVLE